MARTTRLCLKVLLSHRDITREIRSIKRLSTKKGSLKQAIRVIKDGELFLTERIKDLFKTSNGKYIAPQQIETLLLVDKFIDEITIIADERKFVSALVVPNFKLIEDYASDNNIAYNSIEELCKNVKINKMIRERIDTIQQQLASYEKVKRITLLPRNFSIEAGELTNTLKLKRRVINEHYKEEIENMYKEAVTL